MSISTWIERLEDKTTLEMKIPSSVGSKGFPAWPLAPPRILMPSFSPGCLRMTTSCIPGGDGSLRTNIRISCLLASSARTASWCVAWRRSMLFTSKIRSPTRRPLWQARPWGITWRRRGTGQRGMKEEEIFRWGGILRFVTFEMKTPGSLMPNGWLAWSLPPTMLKPRGPPDFNRVTSC